MYTRVQAIFDSVILTVSMALSFFKCMAQPHTCQHCALEIKASCTCFIVRGYRLILRKYFCFSFPWPPLPPVLSVARACAGNSQLQI